MTIRLEAADRNISLFVKDRLAQRPPNEPLEGFEARLLVELRLIREMITRIRIGFDLIDAGKAEKVPPAVMNALLKLNSVDDAR